jgi:toxin ParE1/3/4
MSYSIIVSPRAQNEMAEAVDFYACRSRRAAANFVILINQTYQTLSTHPFFQKYHKEVRAIKIPRYPYLLYFTINEKQQTVKILSCFHSCRHPAKRP